MPSAATIAGSASGKANSRSTRPRPGKAGCRDRARATTIAGTTESSGRERRLPQRECGDARVVGVEGRQRRGKIGRTLDGQADERAADQERDRRQRGDAGE